VSAEPDPESWDAVRSWRKAARARHLAVRAAFSAEERRRHAEAVEGFLRPLLGMETIGFYWPFKGEFDPRPLVTQLHAAGARLALPVVVGKKEPLVFRDWVPGAPLVNGVWDIPVPASGDDVWPDVLLVPALGWDRACYRLGYGGGFYDRTLAPIERRPRTVGVSHAALALRSVFPQAHDVALDCVVTEAGVVRRH
jgi:5-formyltetrahydrofolate cyclo-ligase